MTGLAKTVKRSWPYIAATLLCIAVIVLMCVACATDWYEADGEGQIKVQRNETYPKLFEYLPLSWSIKEDLFSLTLEIGSSSVTCDYKDGKCDAARDLVRAYYNAGAWTTDTCQTPPCYNRPWDVSEYEGAYIGILFFSILSMLLALAVAVLSQLVYWKAMDWERTARGLSIANVVISALLIVSLFITWGILWHHPKMAQGSLDYHSCDEDFEDEENGSFLCSWIGDINVGKQVSRQTEWSGFYWLDYSEEWGPSTAWTLTTVALGLAMASLTLVVGWKPAFES